MAGYSGTPLVRKLGLPESGRAAIVNAPRGFLKLLGRWPPGLERVASLVPPLDYAHVFVTQRIAVEKLFVAARDALNTDGLLWVSWPKKSSGKQTDVSETQVREVGLATGLVDVKICAVDDTWSGLKFVYRLKDR